MASYLPPNETLPIFDTTVFDQETALDYKTALTQFLTYPVAQGDETLQAITVQGQADFENQVNFNFLNSPPHCSIPPTSANDLCNKAYVDSQAPLTAFQLFCNYSQTYTTPTPTTYKLLSDTEVFSPTVLPFTTSAIGTQYITGFFNSISTLNIGSTIPPGNWTFNCYANVSAIGDQSHIGLSYSIIGVSALGVETILYTSASSNLITVVSPSVGIYPMTITVPSTSLSAYTVIGVKLYITSNTGATRTGNIYFQETSYYTNLLTSFSVLAPANIVNSNNVWTGTNTFNNQLSMGASGSNTLTIGGTSANISSTSTTGNLTLSTPASSTGSIAFNTNGSSAMSINSSRIVNMTNPPVMSGASISNGTIPILSVVGTACDISTSQTVGGTKTFSSPPAMSGASISSGTIPITSVVGTACDLTTSQTIGGTKTFTNAPTMSGTGITGGIPITSVVGTAMDLSTTQTVGGVKTFSSTITASNGMTGNASSASVLQGGTAYSLPYQNNLSTTTYLANGATGYLLSSTVSNPPSWKDPSTLTIGTATNATNVNVVDRSATAGAFNIGVVQSLSGNQAIGACSALTYNNTSGILYSPQSLVGPSSNNTAGQNNTFSKFTGVRNDITNNATAGSFKFFNTDGSNVSTNTLTLSSALNTLSAVNNTAPTASPGDNTTTIATTAFVQNALSSVGTATNVNVIDRSATAGAFNIGILQGVSGALPVGACTGLTYNNTSGVLSSTALSLNTTPFGNGGNTTSIVIGVGAGSGTIPNNSVIIGTNAGDVIGTAAVQNTLVGTNAGLSLTSGDRNTLIGANAGSALTTGLKNIMITTSDTPGDFSMTTGNNNTVIGYQSGFNANVSFSTIIGSGVSVTTSNTIAIGRVNETTNIAGNTVLGGNLTLTRSSGTGNIYFTDALNSATIRASFGLTLETGSNNAIYIGSTNTNINQRTVFNSTIGLTSTALSYTNADLGYTASFIDNHNTNIVSGTIYSLACTIPSNGIWLCSGSLCLVPGGADNMTFIGSGFTLASGVWDNPQSGLTVSRNMRYDPVTLNTSTNPYHQFQTGTCVYKNVYGPDIIYFTVQMNWTGSTLQFISEAQITRIG